MLHGRRGGELRFRLLLFLYCGVFVRRFFGRYFLGGHIFDGHFLRGCFLGGSFLSRYIFSGRFLSGRFFRGRFFCGRFLDRRLFGRQRLCDRLGGGGVEGFGGHVCRQLHGGKRRERLIESGGKSLVGAEEHGVAGLKAGRKLADTIYRIAFAARQRLLHLRE